MDWNRFDTKGASSRAAFEAFCCQLFEKWVLREHSQGLTNLRIVDGRGGDGGVEAFASYVDGAELGLQAKWFDGSLGDKQFRQLRQSILEAHKRHPTLATYVVALRADPSDAKDIKRNQKSELDRWNDLVAWVAKEWPDLSVQLWGQSQLQTQLQHGDSQGLRAYWFEKKFVDVDHWNERFTVSEKGWFSQRYLPDLHCTGGIEGYLAWHVQSVEGRTASTRQLDRLLHQVATAEKAIARLSRLPGVVVPANVSALQTDLQAVRAVALSLRAALESGALASVIAERGHGDALPVFWPTELWPYGQAPSTLMDVAGALHAQQNNKRGAEQYGPLRDIVEALDTCAEMLAEASSSLPLDSADLRRIIAIIGDPGVGKTHALAHFVKGHLDSGYPAVLIAARSTSPDKDWGTLLAEHLDLPGWSATEILDALEAGAHLRRRIDGAKSNEEADEGWKSPRALLVIDGLEESPDASKWQRRLRELYALIASRPRVAVAVSTRRGTKELCIGSPEAPAFACQTVYEDSDAPIREIFDRYCAAYRVDIPGMPWLADQLRTPLVVRMFVEENAERQIHRGDHLTLTLPALVKNKIARMESELGAKDPYWNDKAQRAFRAIKQFALASAAELRLSKAKVLEAFRAGVASTGVANDASLENLLEKATREYGFIDATVVPAKTPVDADEWFFAPAFHQVIDVLLAYQALDTIKQGPHATEAPPAEVRGRPDSMALLTTLLAHEGVFILQTQMWQDIPELQRTRWQLRAIADLPATKAAEHADWLRTTLTRSMPYCRMALRELFVPLSRWPGHPFGPQFVHDTLLHFPTAKRDLFWSGPEYLPPNQGAIWEGSGDEIWEDLVLLPQDTWDTLPLLAAWGCASVVEDWRVGLRRRLCAWGAANLSEFCLLLAQMAHINDDQIVEDLLVAAAGASMRCDPADPGLGELAALVDRFYFAAEPEAWRHGCVVRYAARVVVERAGVCGRASDALVARARPPYKNHPNGYLPIHADAAKTNERETSSILQMDLGWYVAKKAIDGFFEDASGRELRNEHWFFSIDQDIKNAAANGLLGTGPKATMDEAQELVAEEEERRAIQSASTAELKKMFEELESDADSDAASGPGDASEALCSASDSLQESEEGEDGESVPSLVRQTTLSTEAQGMLDWYARELALKELSPLGLRNGLVEAYVRSLGWDEATFIADPRGEKPGEVLGADIAITRRHHPASHGARSGVASFAEKYVWSAVNVIAGFLADRVPRQKTWGAGLELADDFEDLGSGMPEPSEPESGDCEELVIVERALWLPEGMLPRIVLKKMDQIARANEWLLKAPWPEVAVWPRTSPIGEDFVVLSAAASDLDQDSQAEVAVWLQAFGVRRVDLPLLLRDAEHAGRALAARRLYELHARLSHSTYLSPSLAAWAPWLQSIEEDSYATFDSGGQGVRISLEPLTAKVMWNEDTEVSVDMPAPALRDYWHLTESLGGSDRRVYLNRFGQRLAYYRSFHDPKHIRWFNHYLVADRSAVAEAIRSQELAIVWAARVYRETNPLLFADDMMTGGPQTGRYWEDREWLVVPDSDALQSFTSLELSLSRRDKEVKKRARPAARKLP